MLVSSCIMHHVKRSVDQIPKRNLTKLQLAFTLRKYPRSPIHKNTPEKKDETRSYKFESNADSRWYYHTLVFCIRAASIFYQVAYKDKLIEAFAVHMMEGGSCLLVIPMIYQQNSKTYINFLNQLCRLKTAKHHLVVSNMTRGIGTATMFVNLLYFQHEYWEPC